MKFFQYNYMKGKYIVPSQDWQYLLLVAADKY